MTATLGVVGDDVTGVLSVGGEIASRGVPTMLVRTGSRGLSDALAGMYPPGGGRRPTCVLTSTESRHDTSDTAAHKVRAAVEALREAGVDYLIKKTDSLLRGNIGAELVGAAEGFGHSPGLCIFAAPAQGRTTVDGIQLVERRRLTELGDPGSYHRSPAPDSDVRRLVGTHSDGVRHVTLTQVESGAHAVEVLLRRLTADSEVRFIVCDAVSSRQVQMLVGAGAAAGVRLFCGTTGTGLAVADALIAAGAFTLPPPVFVVSGTVSANGREQIDHARRTGTARVIAFDPVLAMSRPPADSAVRLAQLRDDVIVSLAGGTTTVLATVGDLDRSDGHAPDLAQRVADALAATAADVLASVRVAGVVATGGDTAEALLEALDARYLQTGTEMFGGVPEARIAGGPFAGLRVVAKAGSFGPRDAIELITTRLQAGCTTPPASLPPTAAEAARDHRQPHTPGPGDAVRRPAIDTR